MDYKKIAVIGCSASGKSYFSKRLSLLLNIPCYHLDNYYWLPNWISMPLEEFEEVVHRLAQNDSWIIDGNYASTMEIRLQQADAVYFLDMTTDVCLTNEKLRRGTKRSDLPNYLEEYEDPEFLDYIKTFGGEPKNRLLNLLYKYPKLDVITFCSSQAVDDYLSDLAIKLQKN